MFKPLALYIGWRYTRAKRRNRFISFISLVSMLGIALGVMVLITVLSVMNGFDQQIRLKIFSVVPHIRITDISGKLQDWQSVSHQAGQVAGVMGSAPYVAGQGLVTRDGRVHPILMEGILPQYEDKVSDIGHKMVMGDLSALKSRGFGIVLGMGIAQQLGVSDGDQVTVMIPQASVTPLGVLPRYKRFKVVGIFDVGSGFGFNETYAFVHLQDAQALYGLGTAVTGVQLKADDLFHAVALSRMLQEKLGFEYEVANWSEQYGPFYHAVQMEKTMMFVILVLLIAIAAFNLVSGLVMLVNDKRADIAILRTIGATPCMVRHIFIVQGIIVSVIGTVMGVLAGILLSLHITQVVNFIQNTFQVELFTPGVYFVDYLPSQLQIMDIVHICLVAFLMSAVATIYPAWRASRTDPVEALRYE